MKVGGSGRHSQRNGHLAPAAIPFLGVLGSQIHDAYTAADFFGAPSSAGGTRKVYDEMIEGRVPEIEGGRCDAGRATKKEDVNHVVLGDGDGAGAVTEIVSKIIGVGGRWCSPEGRRGRSPSAGT